MCKDLIDDNVKVIHDAVDDMPMIQAVVDNTKPAEEEKCKYFSPEGHIYSAAEQALSDALYQIMYGVHPTLSECNTEPKEGSLDPDDLTDMIMHDCSLALIDMLEKKEIDLQTMVYASMVLSPLIHSYWPTDKKGTDLVLEMIPQNHLEALTKRWKDRH